MLLIQNAFSHCGMPQSLAPRSGRTVASADQSRWNALAIADPGWPITSHAKDRTRLMPQFSPPPVPQRLREMLKDYPKHLERLQEVLNHVIQTSSAGVEPFDRAIWVLESRLGTFVSEAREEVQQAESDGEAIAIEQAKAKESLMSRARQKRHWIADDALWSYFQENKDKFE
jgi:hypothetical protein